MTKQVETVTLRHGILRGAQSVTEITVRKPLVPQLKGVSLYHLMHLDVDALRTVLPRITAPRLVKQDFDTMTAEDLVTLGTAALALMNEAEDGEDADLDEDETP